MGVWRSRTRSPWRSPNTFSRHTNKPDTAIIGGPSRIPSGSSPPAAGIGNGRRPDGAPGRTARYTRRTRCSATWTGSPDSPCDNERYAAARYDRAKTVCANSSRFVGVVFDAFRSRVGRILPALNPRCISSIASIRLSDIPRELPSRWETGGGVRVPGATCDRGEFEPAFPGFRQDRKLPEAPGN